MKILKVEAEPGLFEYLDYLAKMGWDIDNWMVANWGEDDDDEE